MVVVIVVVNVVNIVIAVVNVVVIVVVNVVVNVVNVAFVVVVNVVIAAVDCRVLHQGPRVLRRLEGTAQRTCDERPRMFTGGVTSVASVESHHVYE